jgi:hypothetical protein
MESNRIVALHEGWVPDFVWPTLCQLCGSLRSSHIWLGHHDGKEKLSAGVVYQGNSISAIFLYRRKGTRIEVVNEGMPLDSDDVAAFAERVFASAALVTAISLPAVRRTSIPPEIRHLQAFGGEEYSIDLPRSDGEYLARLGRATRKGVRRYRKRLERDYPSTLFVSVPGAFVPEWQVREIVRLNAERLRQKGVPGALGEPEACRLIAMVRECGEVGLVTIGGRVCAGTIVFRVGDDVVTQLVAHDPAYDEYRLGTLACYFTICHFIDAGVRHFYFRSGRSFGTPALQGARRLLYHTMLYRSLWDGVLDGANALRILCSGWTRELECWMQTGAQARTSLPWRVSCRLFLLWRAAHGVLEDRGPAPGK